MVISRPHNRRGGSTLGCLFSLALFVAALYYGIHIGQVYLRYRLLLDDMRSEARLAANLTDDAINRKLIAQADSLLGQSPVFDISRGGHPSRITIEAQYADSVDLPFFKHRFILRPRAEEPL